PRTGSPAPPVSDSGMASPTTSNRTVGASPALPDGAPRTSNTAAPANAAVPLRSAEYFGRERPKPAISDVCLRGAGRRRRIERAHASRPRHLDELPVRRLVYPGDRDAVIGRYQAV